MIKIYEEQMTTIYDMINDIEFYEDENYKPLTLFVLLEDMANILRNQFMILETKQLMIERCLEENDSTIEYLRRNNLDDAANELESFNKFVAEVYHRKEFEYCAETDCLLI